MLRPTEVKKHCDDFNEIAADFVQRFKKIRSPENKIDNLELEAMGWSGETMGKFVYGERLGFYQEPQNQRFYDFMNASLTFGESLIAVASGPPIWKYIPTPAYKRVLKSVETLEVIGDEFIEMIKAKQDSTKDSQTTSHALFDHFITSGGLTSREMNAIALGLTQASFEGTSYTAQWLMYHLSRYPEIQDEAYQEIRSVSGPGKDDFVPYDSLTAMRYVKACIKEAQRLTPTALFLSRVSEQDLVLAGYQIPAGTEMFLFPSLLSRSSKFYENARSFEPDRWMDKKETNPYSYLPFGHGVRMCLGRRVAELELLVFAVHLIRAFRMFYVGSKTPELEFRVGVHKPSEPLEIVFENRKD